MLPEPHKEGLAGCAGEEAKAEKEGVGSDEVSIRYQVNRQPEKKTRTKGG